MFKQQTLSEMAACSMLNTCFISHAAILDSVHIHILNTFNMRFLFYLMGVCNWVTFPHSGAWGKILWYPTLKITCSLVITCLQSSFLYLQLFKSFTVVGLVGTVLRGTVEVSYTKNSLTLFYNWFNSDNVFFYFRFIPKINLRNQKKNGKWRKKGKETAEDIEFRSMVHPYLR